MFWILFCCSLVLPLWWSILLSCYCCCLFKRNCEHCRESSYLNIRALHINLFHSWLSDSVVTLLMLVLFICILAPKLHYALRKKCATYYFSFFFESYKWAVDCSFVHFCLHSMLVSHFYDLCNTCFWSMGHFSVTFGRYLIYFLLSAAHFLQ